MFDELKQKLKRLLFGIFGGLLSFLGITLLIGNFPQIGFVFLLIGVVILIKVWPKPSQYELVMRQQENEARRMARAEERGRLEAQQKYGEEPQYHREEDHFDSHSMFGRKSKQDFQREYRKKISRL